MREVSCTAPGVAALGEFGNSCQAPAPVVLGVSQSRCVCAGQPHSRRAILEWSLSPRGRLATKTVPRPYQASGQPVRVPAVLLALPAPEWQLWSDWCHTLLSPRWLEMLTVYPRTNKQNQKKKRKVEPPTPQVRHPLGGAGAKKKCPGSLGHSGPSLELGAREGRGDARAEAAPSPGVFTFLLRVCGLPSAWSSASPRAGPPLGEVGLLWGCPQRRHCTVPIPPPDRPANCWEPRACWEERLSSVPPSTQTVLQTAGWAGGQEEWSCSAWPRGALRVTINGEHWHSLNSMLLPAPTRPEWEVAGAVPRVQGFPPLAGLQGLRAPEGLRASVD